MKIDAIRSVKLTREEMEKLHQLGAMEKILSAMVSHEDRYSIAMTQEQLISAFRFPGVKTENLLFEMLDLGYIVCNVDQGPIETRGQTVVTSICYSWGTTFFGRDWNNNMKKMTLPRS